MNGLMDRLEVSKVEFEFSKIEFPLSKVEFVFSKGWIREGFHKKKAANYPLLVDKGGGPQRWISDREGRVAASG